MKAELAAKDVELAHLKAQMATIIQGMQSANQQNANQQNAIPPVPQQQQMPIPNPRTHNEAQNDADMGVKGDQGQ